MDVGAYLSPRSGDDGPSGDNLEYESAFIEMELAGQLGEERQVGDSVMAAEEPDWRELADAARAVIEDSHDIRAAVYLCEAVLHTDGLVEFADVVELIAGYLRDYWETCHPQPDEDDGDLTMRISAVQNLQDPERTLSALRRAGLTESRIFGRVSLRDIEALDGVVATEEGEARDAAAIGAAFKDTDPEVIAANMDAVARVRASLAEIDAVFGEQAPGEGPDFGRLTETLQSIDAAFVRFADLPQDEGGGLEEGGDGAVAGGAPGGGGASAQGGTGAINSPEDVRRAIDRIVAYYERAEPSSPVPVILGRAKRLVGADFLQIVKDMASEGMDEVRKIGGLKDNDDDDDY